METTTVKYAANLAIFQKVLSMKESIITISREDTELPMIDRLSNPNSELGLWKLMLLKFLKTRP